jgi:hypothetical protein
MAARPLRHTRDRTDGVESSACGSNMQVRHIRSRPAGPLPSADRRVGSTTRVISR